MKKYILFLLVSLCLLSIDAFAQRKFSFDNGTFKICQFTDLHWKSGSPKCAQTKATIRGVLKMEQPALAVLTGDVVTYEPATKGWKEIIQLFEQAKMPFTVTMGNHDAEYLKKDSIYNLLLASPYYIGEKGPKNIKGCGNCVIPVYASHDKSVVKATLYCIDSNDYLPVNTYGDYDWVHFEQINWYRQQSAFFTKKNHGKPLPSFAFLHIPLVEYKAIIDAPETLGNKLEGGVASSQINPGLFASFIEMKDVMGVFAGHDHENDFLGLKNGIALGYGRVTGADAYGSLKRGARVIQCYEGKRKFDTWICTPEGKEATYYYPSALTSADEKDMVYSPAQHFIPQKHGVAYTYYEGKCKAIAQIANCKKISEGTMNTISIQEAPVKDHFAYDFRTFIKIPERGVYRFYTYSDDGSRLFIDGKQVVDNDGGHSARKMEGKIALDKGFHELRVLYFEDYMGETLEVGFCGRNYPSSPLVEKDLYLPEE